MKSSSKAIAPVSNDLTKSRELPLLLAPVPKPVIVTWSI